MGLLIDGVWHDRWYDTKKEGGRFVRQDSRFRDRVTADGASGFKAEAGRYHLYVSFACPWAHRTLIVRALKGLEAAISVSVVHWHMAENGWEFRAEDGADADRVNGARYLHQVYTKADPSYSGRVTVPVLWDRERATIVNNESSEIIRMLNREFDAFCDGAGGRALDLYPEALRAAIDAVNETVYHDVNNGVYKAGFATSQAAYDEAAARLFETLDALEARLAGQRYLTGGQATEADWRLFTTLVRFDPVYVGHFKCNKRRLQDYPNLWAYCRDLYQVPGVAETVRLDHIKRHYYVSQTAVNPTGIVPVGPDIDFTTPHGRHTLTSP